MFYIKIDDVKYISCNCLYYLINIIHNSFSFSRYQQLDYYVFMFMNFFLLRFFTNLSNYCIETNFLLFRYSFFFLFFIFQTCEESLFHSLKCTEKMGDSLFSGIYKWNGNHFLRMERGHGSKWVKIALENVGDNRLFVSVLVSHFEAAVAVGIDFQLKGLSCPSNTEY